MFGIIERTRARSLTCQLLFWSRTQVGSSFASTFYDQFLIRRVWRKISIWKINLNLTESKLKRNFSNDFFMIALLLVKHKDNAQLPRMVDKVFCLPGEHASASCRIKTLHVQNSSKSLLTSNSFSRSNTWRRVRWDVAAKDLHTVLLARGQWQVTRLNMNKGRIILCTW